MCCVPYVVSYHISCLGVVRCYVICGVVWYGGSAVPYGTLSHERYFHPGDVSKMRNIVKFFFYLYSTVYNDVNAPPPYSETSPSATNGAAHETPHVHEMPDGGQAGALPAKEKIPDDAVVGIIPPKEATNVKADAPVKFVHRRAQPNNYHIPEIPGAQPSATPEDEGNLK